jgi:hypothetical protein
MNSLKKNIYLSLWNGRYITAFPNNLDAVNILFKLGYGLTDINEKLAQAARNEYKKIIDFILYELSINTNIDIEIFKNVISNLLIDS